MSAEVRLSDHLKRIAVLLSEQPSAATDQRNSTVSCSACEAWRRRCVELEAKMNVLQSTFSHKTCTPEKVHSISRFDPMLSDDLLVTSMQDTSPANDIASSYSESNSSFLLIDNEYDHDMTAVALSNDCVMLSQSGEEFAEDSFQFQPSAYLEHDHHCDSLCATQTKCQLTKLANEVRLLQIQLETYKEDFKLERDEKEKLQQELTKLQRQLEIARMENVDASRKWKEFEKEVHGLRDYNQDLKEEVRELRKLKTKGKMIPFDIGRGSSAHLEVLPSRGANKVQSGKADRTKNRMLVSDAPTDATYRICSQCTHQQLDWKTPFCEKCGLCFGVQ